MKGTNHTTVVPQLLERRNRPREEQPLDTTSTVAVMTRVLTPPRLMLTISESHLQRALANRLSSALVEIANVTEEGEALRQLTAESCHILITDSLEIIRRLRPLRLKRNPIVLFVLETDDDLERITALQAGADDCIGRRAPEEELQARVGMARRVAELESVLHQTLQEKRKLFMLDELTGLSSRRFFVKHFPREVERAARYGRPISLIMCDIDWFKRINDTFGHPAGDEVLMQFSARLKIGLRQGVDWVARLGGEEFAIVLPETLYEAALGVARRLRASVSDEPFQLPEHSVSVTASFGLCGVDRVAGENRGTPTQMVKVADAALYRSKRSGRNRVTAVQFPIGTGSPRA